MKPDAVRKCTSFHRTLSNGRWAQIVGGNIKSSYPSERPCLTRQPSQPCGTVVCSLQTFLSSGKWRSFNEEALVPSIQTEPSRSGGDDGQARFVGLRKLDDSHQQLRPVAADRFLVVDLTVVQRNQREPAVDDPDEAFLRLQRFFPVTRSRCSSSKVLSRPIKPSSTARRKLPSWPLVMFLPFQVLTPRSSHVVVSRVSPRMRQYSCAFASWRRLLSPSSCARLENLRYE
jgi:hypothetical protein